MTCTTQIFTELLVNCKPTCFAGPWKALAMQLSGVDPKITLKWLEWRFLIKICKNAAFFLQPGRCCQSALVCQTPADTSSCKFGPEFRTDNWEPRNFILFWRDDPQVQILKGEIHHYCKQVWPESAVSTQAPGIEFGIDNWELGASNLFPVLKGRSAIQQV